MNNLKTVRKKRNLTQAEVAKILDCTAQAYQRYEKGEREADYKTLCKLANFYNVSIDYLIGRSVSYTSMSNLEWTEADKEAGIIVDYREKMSADEREMLDLYRAVKDEKGEKAAQAIRTLTKTYLDGK